MNVILRQWRNNGSIPILNWNKRRIASSPWLMSICIDVIGDKNIIFLKWLEMLLKFRRHISNQEPRSRGIFICSRGMRVEKKTLTSRCIGCYPLTALRPWRLRENRFSRSVNYFKGALKKHRKGFWQVSRWQDSLKKFLQESVARTRGLSTI